MSFNEAGRQKKMCLITANGRDMKVEELPVPSFQRLEKVQGELDQITSRLVALCAEGESVWVEVDYTGARLIGDLRDQLYALTEGSAVEILRIKDRRMMEEVKRLHAPAMVLEEMTMDTVFAHCLEEKQIPEDQRPELTRLFHAVVERLHAGDDE